MDDLAEIASDTHIDTPRSSTGQRSADGPILAETEEVSASCFKTSSSKGKHKVTHSPKKGSSTDTKMLTPSSTNAPSSPKKSGDLSPAKAKLEQVTNKFRRYKKDDPRGMSPEERIRRSEKWRQRFQQLKRTEMEEVEEAMKKQN